MTRCGGFPGGLPFWTNRKSDEGSPVKRRRSSSHAETSGGQHAVHVASKRCYNGGERIETRALAPMACDAIAEHMQPDSAAAAGAPWRAQQLQQRRGSGVVPQLTAGPQVSVAGSEVVRALSECARQLHGRLPRRRALVWFRRDLRLHDNLALDAAIRAAQDEAAAIGRSSDEAMAIIPVYIIHRPVRKRCGAVRFQFLLECLQDLRESLARAGAQLLVLRGDAAEVLPALLPAWGITDLFFEEFVMPYAVARDGSIQDMAKRLGVEVHSFKGATLYDSRLIIVKNGGQVPTTFEDMLKATGEMPQPAQPLPAPAWIPGAIKVSRLELFALLCEFCHTLQPVLTEDSYHYAVRIAGADVHGVERAWHADVDFDPALFGVPPLEEFGLATPPTHPFLTGGESRALRLLEEFCVDEARVGLFQKPRTSPALVDRPSTSCLSAYIAFGCMSPREFFYRIMFIQLKFPGQKGSPETTLDGQLMWREFFYCFATGVPHFDTQGLNPMCKQIAWRLPYEVSPGASSTSVDAMVAAEHLQCWKEGRTGFPWIDAVMRQINTEGWAHHAGRHAVACFLTRGDLYISWLQGAHYFQEVLIDMDWALNIGNWLWVSASCFFRNVRSVHSPSLYVQQWDPEGKYIRKYVPELRGMPTRFVFEPWRAPLSVQRAAKCLVGKHYPFPIVDHQNASRRCIQGVSRAHEADEHSLVASSWSSLSSSGPGPTA